MTKVTWMAAALGLMVSYGWAQGNPKLPANIAAAASDPARGAQIADDARRHGPEILAFAGVKTGAKVVDLVPGSAYWTRLFAKSVGATGHVYGIWPAPFANEDKDNLDAYRMLTAAKDYANVSLAIQPADSISVPEPVDLVFTSQNYHDYPNPFMGPTDPALLNKAVFAALKPGGVYLIVDHAAPAGAGLTDTNTLHRIDPAVVKQQVVAAGFKFVGQSKLLANPADDRRKPVFDQSIRGHTDQFIFKFRKPK